MNNNVYLYGILPAPGPQELELEGLDKQRVQVQSMDGFTFLYSEAKQSKYLASRRNLLSHERVLEEVMHRGYRTILPLQFGLVVETWEEVSDQLTGPYSEALTRLFAHLDGHREVSVKVMWDEANELQLLMAERPELQAQRDSLTGKTLNMDEVIRIGQAVEKAMTGRKNEIVNAFRDALKPLSVESVENDPMMSDMIFNTAFLIPWESEMAFSVWVETLDQQFENRLRIRYNNFTAPFNFAQISALEGNP